MGMSHLKKMDIRHSHNFLKRLSLWAMKEKINIQHFGGRLQISWRWHSGIDYFLLIFSIIWNGIAGFMALVMLADGEVPWMLSLHLATGFLVGYFTTARFLNTTKINVDHQQLEVKHGPIPWFGNKTLPSSSLQQLFVVQEGHEKAGNTTTLLYSVKANRSNDKPINIVSGIRSQEVALNIEQQIERYLSIEDEIVTAPSNPLEKLLKEKFPQLEFPETGPINKGKEPNNDSSRAATIPSPRPLDSHREMLSKGRGTSLRLGEETLQLLDFTQLDWSNGTTDRQAFLQDSKGQPRAIYAEDRGHRGFQYLEERQLSAEEYQLLGLDERVTPPQSLQNGKDKYYQREAIHGFAYPENGRPQSIQQWIYFTTAGPDRFRVVKVPGAPLAVYIQEPVAEPVLATR